MDSRLKWLLVAAFFAIFVAPAFISYQPYVFSWDDSDYLVRAVAASRAFWSGDVHGLGAAMISPHTPIMTLLGLPWGPLASRSAAGNCFITLAALIALLVTLSLYFLLRIGVKPLFLVAAALCVGASLGPYPFGAQATSSGASGLYSLHTVASGFMADSLLAWTSLAAVLLIPYEARRPCPSARSAILRGILCGAILSLGVITKLSFLFFVVLIVPIIFLTRLHHRGVRSALVWLVASVCCLAPAAFYLLRYGRLAFAQAKGASFGGLAGFYHIPLLHFFGSMIRESPGLGFSALLMAAALLYLLFKGKLLQSWSEFVALLITLGFLITVLASPSRQNRYLFPAIVALPFLLTLLIARERESVPAPSHAFATPVAILVLVGLVVAAVPTRHRPNWQSLNRADAVLAQAGRCNAKHIVLATDSPTLNIYLIGLDLGFSDSGVSATTLAYQAVSGVPIEEDFRAMSESDMVVFQDARHINPKFSNQRVPEYDRYIRQGGYFSTKVGDDISTYSTHCGP